MPIPRLAAALVMSWVAGPALGGSTYLALGDSLAWGYSYFSADIQPGPGDQGYVALYADYLGSLSGARPKVLNLGIPQESSASFYTGGQLGQLLNSNYPQVNPPTQHQAMLQSIASEHAMGNTIDHVTVHLGVNDFLAIADASFLDLPEPQQFAQVLVVFDQVIDNLRATLMDIGTLAPEAEVFVMGYYNPYGLFLDHPELDPTDDGSGIAIAQIGDDVGTLLNTVLEALAIEQEATFVPIFDRFDGRELELTRITTLDLGSPNIHPTEAGYAEIAAALIAVPGPAGVLVLAGGMALGRRRR